MYTKQRAHDAGYPLSDPVMADRFRFEDLPQSLHPTRGVMPAPGFVDPMDELEPAVEPAGSGAA